VYIVELFLSILDELAKRELVEEGSELEKVGLLITILEELVAREVETEWKELEGVELLILVLKLVNNTLDLAANGLETTELLAMVLEKLVVRTFDVAVTELDMDELLPIILEVLAARALDMAVNGLRVTELLTFIPEELVPLELDMAAVVIERTELMVGILAEEDKFGLVERIELDRKATVEDWTPDEESGPEAGTIDDGGNRPVEKLELEVRTTGDEVATTEELRKPEEDDRIKGLLWLKTKEIDDVVAKGAEELGTPRFDVKEELLIWNEIEETPGEDDFRMKVEESAKTFVWVETDGIADDISGISTEELESPTLAVLLWIRTDNVEDDFIGGATGELENPAIEVLLWIGTNELTDKNGVPVRRLSTLESTAIGELLEGGINADENVDEESCGDSDTAIVEEALFWRMEELVDDCNGSVAMLEAIETTMRVLEVGINPEDIDNAEVDRTRGIPEIGAENDVAIDNVVTEVVTLDTPKTLETVIGIPRVLEEGIIQCVKTDSMEMREELDGGVIMVDVVTDDWAGAEPSFPGKLELAARGEVLLRAGTDDWEDEGKTPGLGELRSAELDVPMLKKKVENGGRVESGSGPATTGLERIELDTIMGKTGVDESSWREEVDGTTNRLEAAEIDTETKALLLTPGEKGDNFDDDRVGAELKTLERDDRMEALLLTPGAAGGSLEMDETARWLGSTEIDESTEGIDFTGLDVNELVPVIEVTATDETAGGGWLGSNGVKLSIAVDGFADSDKTEEVSMRAELATDEGVLVIETLAAERGAGGGWLGLNGVKLSTAVDGFAGDNAELEALEPCVRISTLDLDVDNPAIKEMSELAGRVPVEFDPDVDAAAEELGMFEPKPPKPPCPLAKVATWPSRHKKNIKVIFDIARKRLSWRKVSEEWMNIRSESKRTATLLRKKLTKGKKI
jgi:hypothetical protein